MESVSPSEDLLFCFCSSSPNSSLTNSFSTKKETHWLLMLAGQVGHWGVNPKVSAVLGVGREEPPCSRSARSEEGDQNNAYETTHHGRALQGSFAFWKREWVTVAPSHKPRRAAGVHEFPWSRGSPRALRTASTAEQAETLFCSPVLRVLCILSVSFRCTVLFLTAFIWESLRSQAFFLKKRDINSD